MWRWVLVLFGGMVFGQDVVLFEQDGQVQWSDTSVEFENEAHRLLADDFNVDVNVRVTRIAISGTMPEERLASISRVRVRVMRDESGLPGPVFWDQTFDDPDEDKDGSLMLSVDELVLDAGGYWLSVSEALPRGDSRAPWRWNGADGVLFGRDYAISSDSGSGPSIWRYSSEVYGEGYPPASLFFRILGEPAPDLFDSRVPPPSFITDRDVWLDEQDRIVVWCPDPNADGAIQQPTLQRGYTFRLVQDCRILESVTATPSSYPNVFRFSSPVPDGPYTIEVARFFQGANKRATEGIPRVYAGPDLASSDTVIATETRNIGRWLLHLPKASGGFSGTVTFFNRFPEIPAPIWVAGFDATGALIDGTRQQLLIVGQVQTLPVYGVGGEEGLFDAAHADRISHLGLFEPRNAALVQASLTYRSLEEDALTATVDEVSLLDGALVGAGFTLDARPAEVYWDGAALLNLTGSAPVEVTVALVDPAGQVLAHRELDPIAPGSKQLLVLSDVFPQSGRVAGYYTLSSEGDVPFQVVGLRGTLVSNPALLVNTKVSKVR